MFAISMQQSQNAKQQATKVEIKVVKSTARIISYTVYDGLVIHLLFPKVWQGKSPRKTDLRTNETEGSDYERGSRLELV